MQGFHIDGGGRIGPYALAREHGGGVRHQLLFPLRDLVRVDIESRRELRHRGVAGERGQRNFRLEVE